MVVWESSILPLIVSGTSSNELMFSSLSSSFHEVPDAATYNAARNAKSTKNEIRLHELVHQTYSDSGLD